MTLYPSITKETIMSSKTFQDAKEAFRAVAKPSTQLSVASMMAWPEK